MAQNFCCCKTNTSLSQTTAHDSFALSRWRALVTDAGEIPGREGGWSAGADEVQGSGKDSFFCDSNRSCHNGCSVTVLHKNRERSGNVQAKNCNCPHHCPCRFIFRNAGYANFAAVIIMDMQKIKFSVRYNFNAAQSKYRGTGAGADSKARM